MKKIFYSILIIGVMLIPSCEEPVSWFADLFSDKAEGYENETFTFTVDTNDEVIEWYIDGEAVQSAGETEIQFQFEPGIYTVGIETSHGLTDQIIISVLEIVEEVEEEPEIPAEDPPEETEPEVIPEPEPDPYFTFSTVLTEWSGLSELSYSGSTLQYNQVSYDLETMDGVVGTPVTVIDTDYGRHITIEIGCYDWIIEGLDGQKTEDLTEEEFISFLENLYLMEEPVPVYDYTLYSLTGHVQNEYDSFFVDNDNIIINGESFTDDDFPFVYVDNFRVMQIQIDIEQADSWFWYNTNLSTYFELDSTRLTRDELIIMADMIARHPDENWVELQAVYNPQ